LPNIDIPRINSGRSDEGNKVSSLATVHAPVFDYGF